MQLTLKKNADPAKTVVALALCFFALALGCMYLGYVMLPFAAAFYAALLIYDKKKIASVIMSVIVLVINVFFNGILSLDAIGCVILGTLLFFLVKANASKAEAAVWLTAVTAIIICVTLIFVAIRSTREFSFEAVKGFYGDFYYSMKEEFSGILANFASLAPDQPALALSPAEVEALFNNCVLLTPAFILIFAFAVAGFMLKVATALFLSFSGQKEDIFAWQFRATGLLAYFYLIVSVVNFFSQTAGGVFAMTVVTLATVFSVVFAYLGAKFLFFIIASRRGSVLAILILVGGFLIASSYAITILSIIGAVFTIKSNKKPAKRD